MSWINLFIPEKIGRYQIFPKRVVGFDIGKTHVNATKLYISGKTTIIKECLHEKIELSGSNNYHERVIRAIESIRQKIGKFDEVRTAIASNQIIFKELTLPFISRDKIQMVLNFEIEGLLPFPLDKAALDFIITKKNSAQNSSEILVAATQKSTVENHIALFQAAGIEPSIVTVDLFALYNLYNHIPEYRALEGGVVLLDLGFQSTRIGFILDGQLKRARTISIGISQLTKIVAQKLDIPAQEALEKIINYGTDNNKEVEYANTIKSSMDEYWSQVQFTLASFAKQLNLSGNIHKIFMIGGGSEINDLPGYVSTMLNIPCEPFNVGEIATNKMINLDRQMTIPHYSGISLGTALDAPSDQSFNLLETFLQPSKILFLNQQLITTGILIIALFTSIFGYSFWQYRQLQSEVRESQEELIELVSQELAIKDPESLTDAESIIEAANAKLKKEEKMWYAFSAQTRRSFLEYLKALSTTIDRASIGLELKKLSMDESTISMDGSVRGFEELAIFEDELNQLKQFSLISVPQKPEFNITMKIKKPRGRYGNAG
jgi:type IV pilus assembly protein PilM